jgi:cellulose biosynthesis protein BcsQ
MALANIAYELSKRKFKVLIVDWDLEAPGIERFFNSFKIENSSEGLLQLLLAYKNDNNPNYQNYLWKVDTLNEYPISLLHSGRCKDPAIYSSLLQNFDWSDFFADNKGGYHLENLRTAWHNDFDFVLIDSRTGLSDSSGVCTILMPDILIPMFTANYQSLFGIRDIVKLIQNARQKLEVDRMALTVLPIPSRFGTRVEFKESQEWLERIADILKDCYGDWLPIWIEPKYILEQIKIPQIDYFSFGEKLAVVEQGTNDPEGMGFIFSRITSLLSSDFSDIENFVGKDYYQKRKNEFEAVNQSKEQEERDSFYDVYISCPRMAYQWVRELLIPTLTEYLTDELKYKPQIFFDLSDVYLNVPWSMKIETAIEKAKTYILIISDSGLDKTFLNVGLNSILNREKTTRNNLLFPVVYSQSNPIGYDSLPYSLKSKHFTDLSKFKYEDTVNSTKLRSQFGQAVDTLSKEIAKTINQKSKTVNENKNNLTDDIQKLLQLARDYEEIRINMPGGDNRTRVMEGIVAWMKSISNDPTSFLPTLTKSKSPGERLVAIAKLQKFPNLKYIDWLAAHVGDVEKPFIGYNAAVALYIASRTFWKENKMEIENALLTAKSNIEKYQYKDPNQIKVIRTALNEVNIQ